MELGSVYIILLCQTALTSADILIDAPTVTFLFWISSLVEVQMLVKAQSKFLIEGEKMTLNELTQLKKNEWFWFSTFEELSPRL